MTTRKQPTNGVKIMRPARFAPYDKAYKAGIREVVEWASTPCPHTHPEQGFVVSGEPLSLYKRECTLCWRAQLKKWEIE